MLVSFLDIQNYTFDEIETEWKIKEFREKEKEQKLQYDKVLKAFRQFNDSDVSTMRVKFFRKIN